MEALGASNSVNVWETSCPFPQMIFLRQPKPFLRLKIEVKYDRVNITAGESEVLWPLIERWEETGHQRDLDALEVAMERLWRARQEELEIEADSTSEVESKTEL